MAYANTVCITIEMMTTATLPLEIDTAIPLEPVDGE